MKKIKIIDLLNMISKGEEVPEKIKVFGEEFNYDGYDYYSIHSSSPLMSYVGEDYLRAEMNYDIEIIEEPHEHKIPEKICTNRIINTKDILEFEMIQNKINAEYTYAINEILDYLEGQIER